jgi:hypothetical protein
MSGLSRDSPTNRGYYAESSQARALTIGDLGHPLHISTFCAYFLCAAAHKMYLHADMRMKEKALSHAEPLGIKPARYRTDDQLLAFWKASDYADCGRHGSPSQPQSPLSIRHNQEVGMFLVYVHADKFGA